MLTARSKRGLAVALAASLVTALLTPMPAPAAPYRPPVPNKERVIGGKKNGPSKVEDVRTGKAFTASAPVWPKAGAAEVDLGAVAADKTARAGGGPVSVAADGAAKTKPKIKVETFDRDKTRKAGVDGLLLKVSGGPAKIEVDYSSFRWAYGADWASRLKLVELPECALTTPDKPECAAKPVASRNDVAKGKVTAAQASPSGGAVMALTAGTSSGSGSYKATSLSPSATWSAGSNTGGFSWNYPLRMPPSLGGPTPSLTLGYSSSSVDGRMAASNNQPSWIGEGFDLGANFIERKYIGCAGDMADGARNIVETGDLCWRNENATLTMTGHGGELIKEAAPSNRWRLRNDDGTRVEFRTGADNGARNGEHWIVTTPDGTQHWFGRGTQSVLNVPVAGNHAGEPCAEALFKDSFCSQPWRWNLEYVVDVHGNTMTYSYDKETNKYGRNNSTTDLAQYDRASVLKQIDYGTRVDRTETAPMQVVLEPADRCLVDCGTKDAAHWPDVPWDQECTASPCRYSSPTFWGTKRLASVTTKVGGNAVEKWTLSHSFPDPGDGTRAGLWLDKISRVGLVGQQTPVPDVRFQGIQLSNRVDTHSDQLAAMKWWRLKRIFTDSGGQIDVTYAQPDCVVGSRMPNPNALQDNNLRCYPVRWTPEGNTSPIWDYFHKYVVESMIESDLTGGSVRVLTQYDYVGDPAWHFSDDDGFVKAEDKTWSVWRGYGAVKTRLGEPEEQTLTERRYFRGMHGDKLPSGTRNAQMPAIAVGNVAEVNDEDAFAGMVREEIIYNGPGGAEVSATVNGPWQSDATASRTINGVTVHARYVQSASKHTRTALDSGRGFRTTSQVTDFEQTYGTATQTEDRGDDAVAGDEKCILIDYAHNTSDWVIGKVSRKRDFVVDCAKAKSRVGLQDADIAGDLKTYYDGQDHGVAPTKGDPTKTQTLKSYVNGTETYLTESSTERDAYGRVTKLTDPKGTVSTAYTPAAGAPVTQIITTNTLGWTTTTVVEPAWGSPVSTTDPNQWKTDIRYDGLGRTTEVSRPGYSKKFSYLQRTDKPSVVSTSTPNTSGQYVTSYELFDGLLRPRQTQQPDATGSTSNTVVTDVHYDSAGRAKRANSAYLANVAPGNDLFVPTDPIPSATMTTYDGAGREIAQALKKLVPASSSGGDELFRTTTYYAGDRTDVTPPAGGVVQSTLVDAQGRKSELRQYHSGVVAGAATGFDATKYTYDRKGKLTEVAHPSGKKWQYSYDMRGRQTRAVDPDKGITESSYDDAGQLTSTKDGRGNVLAYTYDALGRKTSTRDDSATGPARSEWFYDTLADGTTLKGVLVKSVRRGERGAYVMEHVGIRADYQPSATNFTVPDAETGLGGTYSYVYTYHSNGVLNSTRIPATGDLKRETLEYNYDALGQPATQKTGYGTSPQTGLVTSTGYTSFGELASYQLRNNDGNTVDIVRNYDQFTRRLNQIWTTKQTGPSDVAKVSYSHDWAGNVTRVADSVSADTQCFEVDYLRRLSEAWTPTSGKCNDPRSVAGLGGPSKYWQSYSYNVAGDRTKLVEHGTSAGDRTTEYFPTPGKHSIAKTVATDNAGSRQALYTYDEVGNTLTRPSPGGATQTMTWDRESRVATTTDETGQSSYIYDADGNRLVRRDPTGATLYLPGQELRYTTSSGTKVCTRYYTHAGQSIAMRTSTGLTWMSSDQHGTAQNTINALGQQTVSTRRTLPFGEIRGNTGTWPARLDKGFVGGTLDNTGLTHIGAREYDPKLGRFISVDPIMDLADPRQWNAYVYSNNSPVTFSDPTGLYCDSCNYYAETKGEHSYSGYEVGCGYSPNGLCGPTGSGVSQEDYQQQWRQQHEWTFGTGDGSNQPIIYGHRLPTAEEMKRGPIFGAPVMMAPGETYAQAVKHWASYVCNSSNPGAGFCEWSYTVGNSPANGWDAVLVVVGAVGLAAGAVGGSAARGAAASSKGAGSLGKAAKAVETCETGNSFTGDTRVLMADGSTKRIDAIELGDEVFAADPETGESGAREVTATIIGEGVKFLVEIEIRDASKIVVTDRHPLWLPDQNRWAEARDLHVGSVLRTSTGAQVAVTAVESAVEIKRVHNLTIAGLHTYHVVAGDAPILAHNCGFFKKWLGKEESALPEANATVRDLQGLNLPDFARGGMKDKMARNRSDEALLNSVFNPDDKMYMMVWSDKATMGNGNHRAAELLRRANDPNSSITLDTPIYVKGLGG